jgi:hypothetical protein
MEQGRREFVKLIVFFGAGSALAACGGSDSGGDNTTPTRSCTAHGGTASAITANHGHALMVPVADFTSPQIDHTYSIQGSAGHDHTITLTGAQLADVLAGNTVTVTSTETLAHTHGVTVICASGTGGGGYTPGGGY